MPLQATPEEYFGQQLANQLDQQPIQPAYYYFTQPNNQTIYILALVSIIAIVAITALYLKR